MTPQQAQGGTQSVEDAKGFVLFNRPGVDRSSMSAVLQDFAQHEEAPSIQDPEHHSRGSGEKGY